jgi:hypothetical protein
MLQAHIDDSGWDGVSPAFVLAGYLAKKEQWDVFSHAWQQVLDQPEPRTLPYLKTKDAWRLNKKDSTFYGWTEQQRDSRLIDFIKVINRNVMHGIVSVVPIEPYVRIMARRFKLEPLDRPYFVSFFGVMRSLLLLMQRLNLDDRVAFIFDTQGNEPRSLLHTQYDIFLGAAPPGVKELSAGPPRFEKEEEFLPLQAADMIAWHARRYYYELEQGKDPTKEPSNVFFANMFDFQRDIFDLWTEDRIKEAGDALALGLWPTVRHKFGRGIPMMIPDPFSPWKF